MIKFTVLFLSWGLLPWRKNVVYCLSIWVLAVWIYVLLKASAYIGAFATIFHFPINYKSRKIATTKEYKESADFLNTYSLIRHHVTGLCYASVTLPLHTHTYTHTRTTLIQSAFSTETHISFFLVRLSFKVSTNATYIKLQRKFLFIKIGICLHF